MRKLCPTIAILLGLLIFPLFSLSANNAPSYIERFKDIAIREMHRSGIPASITLAQAIHESAWGNGKLALNSNNYFGIKCKDYWVGPKYYIEDDDYQNGELIKSCFRAYEKIEDSFVDHSDFLKDNPRYNKLFALNPTDYRAWAKGLQECGYATDEQYAEKLIKKIEQYQLYQYDMAPNLPQGGMATSPAPAPRFNISGFVQGTAEATVTTPASDNTPIAPVPDLAEETYDIPEAVTLPDDYQRGANRESTSSSEPLYLGTQTSATPPVIDHKPDPSYEVTATSTPERTEQIATTYAEPVETPAIPQQENLPVPAPVYSPPAPSPNQVEGIIRMTYASDDRSSQLSRRPRVSDDRRR